MARISMTVYSVFTLCAGTGIPSDVDAYCLHAYAKLQPSVVSVSSKCVFGVSLIEQLIKCFISIASYGLNVNIYDATLFIK